MENSDDDTENIEAVRRRWEELKEKAKKDFESVNSHNQAKVNQAKLKIANYVKGAVSYLRRDLNLAAEESSTTDEDINFDQADLANYDESDTKEFITQSLAELQARGSMLLDKANKEFQRMVDEVKARISKTVIDNHAKNQQQDVTVTAKAMERAKDVDIKLNELKRAVEQAFDEANSNCLKIVEETKAKLAKSMHDIAEYGMRTMEEAGATEVGAGRKKSLSQLQAQARLDFIQAKDATEKQVAEAKETISKTLENA